MSDDNKQKVIEFPGAADSAADVARRLKSEVERLARLPTVEWMYYVTLDSYAAKYGIKPGKLKEMVEAVVRANEKASNQAKAEQRAREERAEKDREKARKEEDRKRRERASELEKVAKLPRAEREKGFADAAKRL